MKTREPPSSSKGRDKAEESAPHGKTPMARFRSAAKTVVRASPEAVRKEELKARRARKRDD